MQLLDWETESEVSAYLVGGRGAPGKGKNRGRGGKMTGTHAEFLLYRSYIWLVSSDDGADLSGTRQMCTTTTLIHTTYTQGARHPPFGSSTEVQEPMAGPSNDSELTGPERVSKEYKTIPWGFVLIFLILFSLWKSLHGGDSCVCYCWFYVGVVVLEN